MTDPKKKVKSDKDKVVQKKNKKYNVQVSKRTKASEKDGRMQAARESAMKSDIKKAGSLKKYLKKYKTAQSATKPRKAY